MRLFTVLSGHAVSIDGHGTPEERVISVHGRGRFPGELSPLTGEASSYTAVAAGDGEVLAAPVGQLRGLIASDPASGDLVPRACLSHRSILIGPGAGLRIAGSRYSPDAPRLRDYAARNRLPYRWLDLEADPAAETLLQHFGVTPEETPTVIAQAGCCATPATPNWPPRPGSRRRAPCTPAATWWWPGPARRAFPPPCTGRRKESGR